MNTNSSSNIEPRHALAIIVFILVGLGLVVLSSASAIIAYRNFGSNDFYFWKQFRHLIVGIVAWIIFYNIPYKIYKNIAPIIYIMCIFFLLLVFVPGIGAEYGTAKSWIDFPFLPSIQPAEYSKIGIIIYIAFLCERKGRKIIDFAEGFLPIILVSSLVIGLIIIQPDYGTALIFMAIIFSIIFIAGADKWHLIGSFFMGALLAVIVAFNKQYIYDRFTAFLDPSADSLGTGYHILQSLIAVGSGGFMGKGFGNSRQKFEYVPEAQGDSIFAIISEELGFFRVVLLVLLFTTFAWYGYKIASETKDLFGKYLAIGITSWIAFQAMINIMVVTALFPTTGVPLPFISYGGSSLLSSLIAVGILMNIGRFEEKDRSAIKRKIRAGSGGDISALNVYSKGRWKK